MEIVNFILTVQFFVHFSIAQQLSERSYKAAVLEYAPKDKASSTKQNFITNVDEYIRYIQQAAFQDVQILVFPEYGLTGWFVNQHDLEEISTEVPDPDRNIIPCSAVDNNKYAKFLIDFSCIIQRQRIYTVINLIEWRFDNYSKKKFYHNTNVAFDRNGAVIARYRKINLYDEPYYVPGPNEVSTFTTDFGVTFGMLICSDILFQSPAQDILSNLSVTDIIFSTAWFSELPFLQANSIQHGYAKSNKINLLAAGMNNPSEKNGGSGIYLADGTIVETYLSGEKKSMLIIQHVPKIGIRKDDINSCQGSSGKTTQSYHLAIGKRMPDVTLFHTVQSDLSNYTFKSLNLNNRTITETICSGESDFCCTFKITVNKHSTIWQNYVYKLAAYYGVSKLTSTKTVGIRNCGLIACLDETNQSCGGRNMLSPSGISFESISIKGKFNPKDSHYQPSTLKFDLTPASDYTYCTELVGRNEIEINMITAKRHDSLLTFGITGRVFINDNMIQGPINIANTFNGNTYFILIIIFIHLRSYTKKYLYV